MRVAVFTDVFLEVPGGIPSSIRAQKTALSKLGHEVTVFCPGFSDSLKKLPVEDRKDIVIVPSSRILKPNEAPLARWPGLVIKFVLEKYPDFDKRFDIIHIHYEAGASIAAVILAKRFGLPIVQTMHGREDMAIAVNVPHPFKTIAGSTLNAIHKHYLDEYDSVKTVTQIDGHLAPTLARAKMWDLMVRQANCAGAVITPSQHFADKLKHYGVKKPIEVVSNGVADDVANLYDWKVREYDGEGALRIFWASRLSKEKRIMEFLEALVIVNGKGGKVKFTCVGNGNQLDKAKRFAAEHGLNAKFYGAVPHEKVLEMEQDQHLSITNSYGFDTQGLTLLEASVAGLPQIFCDQDMRGVVCPGGAMCAENETPEAMAELILSIIKEPKQVAEMSKVCLRHQDDFLQSAQIKKLLDVYKTVLG